MPGSLSETLSSLRECLNSNQSWNFVQAQFFHKFRFMLRLMSSVASLNLKNLGRIAVASVKEERSKAQDEACCSLTKFVRPASNGSSQAKLHEHLADWSWVEGVAMRRSGTRDSK